VASESKDADQVSSDDGAGKAAVRIRDNSKNKKKSKKHRKWNCSSSSSLSSSSSSSAESSSSSSLSGSSSSSKNSGGDAESSRAARRHRKRQKKSQKKAEHKYKKLKSGWKVKQPTAYNRVVNFDVFELWVFEVDLWMHDTGFKKLEAGNRSIKDFMCKLRLYDKRLGDLAEHEVRQRLWDGVHLYIRLKWTESRLNPEDSTLSKMVKTTLRYERTKQMRKEETKKAEMLKSDYTQTKLTRPDKARNSRARSRLPEQQKGNRKETKDEKPKEKKSNKPEKCERSGKSLKPEKKMDNAKRKLTPKEKEQYRAEGRCFKCGDVGHKSHDCLRKNKAKPSHISSSAVCLKAMDNLANAVNQLKCSAAKVKTPKATKEQVAKAVEQNASVVKDITRRVPKMIIIEVLVNGEPANAMLDTGSQSDLMSSTLADQLKLPKT
ncbi:hypothetical protein FRC11_001229, partial [Ceratobasidium sp. 423]